MGIQNLKFKDGVTCPIFKNAVIQAIMNQTPQGTTYGSRRIGTCPDTGKPVLQEFNSISNGEEQWICLHNTIPEDDAVDIAAFKKRHNL